MDWGKVKKEVTRSNNYDRKPCRVLGQIVALVMVNKHMKFHKICFDTQKVIAKVKVCHNHDDDNDDDDNDYAAANDDDDTRVMTIPRLFSLKGKRA